MGSLVERTTLGQVLGNEFTPLRLMALGSNAPLVPHPSNDKPPYPLLLCWVRFSHQMGDLVNVFEKYETLGKREGLWGLQLGSLNQTSHSPFCCPGKTQDKHSKRAWIFLSFSISISKVRESPLSMTEQWSHGHVPGPFLCPSLRLLQNKSGLHLIPRSHRALP